MVEPDPYTESAGPTSLIGRAVPLTLRAGDGRGSHPGSGELATPRLDTCSLGPPENVSVVARRQLIATRGRPRTRRRLHNATTQRTFRTSFAREW